MMCGLHLQVRQKYTKKRIKSEANKVDKQTEKSDFKKVIKEANTTRYSLQVSL